jgi:UMF1 family MFS transporter
MTRHPQPAEVQSFDRLKATCWVLYDLANTIYAASLTYVVAPLYSETFGRRTPLGVTQTVSMVLAGLLVPALGALADQTGRARRYLIISTVLCVASFGAMSPLWRWEASVLAALFLANISYNTALVFYNALLASVAPPQKAGLVSGVGVAVGYFGNVATLVLLIPVSRLLDQLTASQDPLSRVLKRLVGTDGQGVLVIYALLFLIVATPCLYLVADRRERLRLSARRQAVQDAITELVATLRSLPLNRPLLWFLLGNFCLVDVLNTAILYFADASRDLFQMRYSGGELSVFGWALRPAPDDPQLGMKAFTVLIGLSLTALAMLFGFLFGLWADRTWPVRPLRVAGWCLVVALVGGAIFGGRSEEGYLFTLVAFGAAGLAGIWTAGRKVLLSLAPPEQVGQYFGLYGITTKVSVIGSTTFAVISDHFGTHWALLSQSLPLGLGLVFLYWMQRAEGPVSMPQKDRKTAAVAKQTVAGGLRRWAWRRQNLARRMGTGAGPSGLSVDRRVRLHPRKPIWER